MARLGLVDQNELRRWADSRGAAADLPRLIRRLILETGRGIVELGFPGGEGIASGGWDGTARATEATAHIPQGLSLWELSVERGVGSKADRDYAKRTATPDGTPTTECTYVAASLRRWGKRREWAQEKRRDARWRDVRAFGVDDIEEWLESSPVTHAWVSELLGFHPHGLLTIETWWDGWSTQTMPSFPPEGVLGGREAAVDALRTELSKPPQIVTASASSDEEVAAFLAAVATVDAAKDGGALRARSALVDRVEAWRRLREHQRPLVLLPWVREVADEIASGSAHHLIVPVVEGADADITLPPIDPVGCKEALRHAGLEEDRAEEVGRIARLSVRAARRSVANKPELHRPDWATPPVERLVRRSAVAGRWHENTPGDREIIEGLFEVGYDELREQLAPLATGIDPLLARTGASLSLVSHVDAWLLLRNELGNNDLERFREGALEVLSLPNPELEFPPSERWRAAAAEKRRPHSADLRTGLATTLALLGVYGEASVDGSGMTGESWARWIVREILERANALGGIELWASLRDVLTLLAEAAPAEFLDAVRDGLAEDPPLLRSIFMDSGEGGSLFADSTHSSLLWALEVCAWSPDHLGQVVDLLARLAEVDPGGQFANRPGRSLEEIFCPWHPQNSVSNERRLSALDGLRDRHPEVAWKLLISMLPDQHGISHPTAPPTYRHWKPSDISVTWPDYWQFIDEVCKRLLDDAAQSVERWRTIVDEVPNLPEPRRGEALERLDQFAAEGLEEAERVVLWEMLRSKAAHHREFASAPWALPEAEVARLEQVAERFAPTSAGERWRWLFDEHLPDIPDVAHRADFQGHSVALAEVRADAARAIAGSLEWPELHAYAKSIKLPWFFAAALAQAGVLDHEARLIDLLGSDEAADKEFAEGYLSQRFRTEGWAWLEPISQRDDLSGRQRALLLLLTHDYPVAWERAEGFGQEVSTEFWRAFRVIGLGDFAHVETAAAKLLETGRPRAALDLLALYKRQEEDERRADLMAESLERLLDQPADDSDLGQLSRYQFMEIFSALERSQIERDRLGRLEWAYLPIFEFEKSPPTLGRFLAENPQFFVDVLSRVYRPRPPEGSTEESEEEAEPEADETEQALATNAYRLLSDWRTVPGLREDGTIDADLLNTWVDEARPALRDTGRLGIGDEHIGRVFASSPPDPDGSWPPHAVRDLLERVQSSHMEDGLRLQIFNDRGVTTRALLAGGEQERTLAERYHEQSEQFVDRWPRTAAILRELAESYERSARREDDEAERLRRGLDR